MENERLAEEHQKKCDTILTIDNKITYMDMLIQFSESRDCYIGMVATVWQASSLFNNKLLLHDNRLIGFLLD